MLVTVSLLVLIIDAAAVINLITSDAPSYILEFGVLILSMIYFLVLPNLYSKLKKKDKEKEQDGRF